MSKLGKKITLNSDCERFKITIGAIINHKNPRSIYFTLNSWLSFDDENIDVKYLLREYRKEIKNFLKNNEICKKYFDLNSIIDIKVSESRVRLGKATYFELDVTLFQKDYPNSYPFENKNGNDLKSFVLGAIDDLFKTDLFCSNEFFKFHYKMDSAVLEMNKKSLV